MQRILLCLSVLGFLLLATPARAFFEEIDLMQAQLTSSPGSPLQRLSTLLQTLDQVPVAFSDVPEDSWYRTFVLELNRFGIVSGYRDTAGNPTGKFGPGYLVTVAEVVKMALRAAGVDETQCMGTLRHPGASSHWARDFVLCGEQKHMRVLAPFPDLDRSALRGEVVAMIDDAFGAQVPVLRASFKDTRNHAYEEDIAYAASRGIVSGDTDAGGMPTGTFRPDDRINRAEVAKMIYLQLQVSMGRETPEPAQAFASSSSIASIPSVSSRSSNPPPPVTIDITVTDFAFTPSSVLLKHGQEVTLRFHTTGSHTFTVDGLGFDWKIPEGDATFAFTPDTAGTFPFHCTTPGHKESWMTGKLIVQ